MPSSVKSRVTSLTRDIRKEITELERELREKQELLRSLEKISGKATRRRAPRRAKRAVARRAPRRKATRGVRRATPKRRKSKNRDAILEAARTFRGTFKLHQLTEKLLSKNPRFGGQHPSGTILAVLKNTPEIKKVRRGLYTYRG